MLLPRKQFVRAAMRRYVLIANCYFVYLVSMKRNVSIQSHISLNVYKEE